MYVFFLSVFEFFSISCLFFFIFLVFLLYQFVCLIPCSSVFFCFPVSVSCLSYSSFVCLYFLAQFPVSIIVCFLVLFGLFLIHFTIFPFLYIYYYTGKLHYNFLFSSSVLIFHKLHVAMNTLLYFRSYNNHSSIVFLYLFCISFLRAFPFLSFDSAVLSTWLDCVHDLSAVFWVFCSSRWYSVPFVSCFFLWAFLPSNLHGGVFCLVFFLFGFVFEGSVRVVVDLNASFWFIFLQVFLQCFLVNFHTLSFFFQICLSSGFVPSTLLKGLSSFKLFFPLLSGLFPSNLSMFRPSRFYSRVFFLQSFLTSIFSPSSLSSGVFLPPNSSSFSI